MRTAGLPKRNASSIRPSIVLLGISCASSCSFDATFFPVDEKPAGEFGTGHESIVIESADQQAIHHVLIKPAAEPKATLVVFHGSASNVSNWADSLAPLLAAGYQLFLMEYRGFGKSEGEAGHDVIAADARRAIAYVKDRRDVRSRPLLVLGQSYGGQLAINVAAAQPDAVDALVLEGTFTSFREIALYSTPAIGRPLPWLLFRNPYSARELIEEVSVPILIIHSREDRVVPFCMGRELFEAAKGVKEFWAVTGEHTDALAKHTDEYVSRVDRLAGL